MKEILARRWDAMAAENDAATRKAAERRRLGFVQTAFRGLPAQTGLLRGHCGGRLRGGAGRSQTQPGDDRPARAG